MLGSIQNVMGSLYWQMIKEVLFKLINIFNCSINTYIMNNNKYKLSQNNLLECDGKIRNQRIEYLTCSSI